MATRSVVGVSSLTPFEERVLSLLATGLGRQEIACALKLSPQTVSNALTVAKEKMCARSLVEAAVLLTRASDR